MKPLLNSLRQRNLRSSALREIEYARNSELIYWWGWIYPPQIHLSAGVETELLISAVSSASAPIALCGPAHLHPNHGLEKPSSALWQQKKHWATLVAQSNA